jgi:uncharacterized protein (DUF849 family)
VDVVINLTAGMGGDLVVDQEDPLKPMDGTDLDYTKALLANTSSL